MFKHLISVFAFAFALTLGCAASAPVHADDLLVKRVQKEYGMNMPSRGMSMTQVKRKFGVPQHKLASRGGDTAKHPRIHRWEYPGYIVYFEHSHVIHSVLNTPAGNNKHPETAH